MRGSSRQRDATPERIPYDIGQCHVAPRGISLESLLPRREDAGCAVAIAYHIPLSGSWKATAEEGGKTRIHVSVVFLNGKEQPGYRDVWKRVKQSR
jgi:hypothetical protein